jgi:hypothetical protein
MARLKSANPMAELKRLPADELLRVARGHAQAAGEYLKLAVERMAGRPTDDESLRHAVAAVHASTSAFTSMDAALKSELGRVEAGQ